MGPLIFLGLVKPSGGGGSVGFSFKEFNMGSAVKNVKKSKAVEIEEFRAEVQNYLKTGKSDVLSIKEKAQSDALRPKQSAGLLSSIGKFFKN